MFTFIGFIVVFLIIFYKRATEIVVVNPMRGLGPAAPALREPSDSEKEPDSVPDFARLLNTIQQASTRAPGGGAKLPVNQGRAAIIKMVENNQFIEAMQLYRRLYGVDLAVAKKAIDKIMLER